MREYRWKDGSHVKLDAERVALELNAIADDPGSLTQEAVVEVASNPLSSLHDHFEWDDRVAAQGYRLEQARYLLRSLVVVVDGGPAVRAFLSVVVEEGSRQTFEPLQRVMTSVELRRQVLMAAARELEAFRKKYEEYEELASVFAAIEATRAQLVGAPA